ncbi:hypothetical protein H0Z11_09025 [Pantoea agglomerans]|uniref:hypothetical protein n=1 Tax=Enterobacter agglomerans TaxID=549 RepID=UPI001AA05B3D|nr:hypothetical protein [Pantoea agglomerans]QTC48781.1 hypothetical protein H0Z11_09025 [Pantoea agglomerans]
MTSQLPKARQKMVAEMLDALIVQAQQQETDSQETGFLARVEGGEHHYPKHVKRERLPHQRRQAEPTAATDD